LGDHASTGSAPCACPGSAARTLNAGADFPVRESAGGNGDAAPSVSRLGHWPVQLGLLPVQGRMWDGADVLIAADCVPFAMPDFHEKLLAGKTVAVGCPKLDDVQHYAGKLSAIFAANHIRSVTVVRMEVPCCGGIVMAAKHALDTSGKKDVEFRDIVVGVDGAVRS
jgi:hypothetical protein